MAIWGSSLTSAISGIKASQRALEVTGHNLTNAETKGYTRQRLNLSDYTYSTVGVNGNQEIKVGNGVDIDEVQQIRNTFLDISYRNEVSTMKFYEAQMYGVSEMESILGEQVGGVSYSTIINRLWDSMNELSKHPEGIESRAGFVQNAALLIEQGNQIQKQFSDYQYMLNDKVKDLVDEVNGISSKIQELNGIISSTEIGGANANDYRDQRNNLLDRLGEIIDITYYEDMSGSVIVNAEGRNIIDQTSFTKIQAVIDDPDAPFYKVTWEGGETPVFDLDGIDTKKREDRGELKGVLALRGDKNVDYTYLEDSAKYAEIKDSVLMKTMAQFDYLLQKTVSKINDLVTHDPAVGGNKVYGLDGSEGVPLFIEIKKGVGLKAGNIMINPIIKNNVEKLGLSKDVTDPGDNEVVMNMIKAFEEKTLKIEPDAAYKLSINSYYGSFVAELGGSGKNAINHYNNQSKLVSQVNNQRQSIAGVSTDQELSNMIMFQQAYNANAKVITVIDEMVESLLNL